MILNLRFNNSDRYDNEKECQVYLHLYIHWGAFSAFSSVF